ncbi:MAG TPA: pyridoxine 5'-phosphate synthase [Gammaproteobacteria bacterium]
MLSVNVNKVALLRNVRDAGYPDVLEASRICLAAGAGGITVHPRPDRRHTRPEDALELAALLRDSPGRELNIEGNPFPEFLELVWRTKPTQCTLVPDSPDALTSDHGWDLEADGPRLRSIVRDLHEKGIRVSLFVDPDPAQIRRAKEVGSDRIELYTESYARAHGTARQDEVLDLFVRAAAAAREVGLGVNAGHDLALDNLGLFCRTIPDVLEVSIGHALISYSLEVGLRRAVEDYRRMLAGRRRHH